MFKVGYKILSSWTVGIVRYFPCSITSLRQFINEWKQILQCGDNLFMKEKKTLAHRWLWKLQRFELGCLDGTAKLGPFSVWYPSPLPTYCVEHVWTELCCAFEAWLWNAAKQKWVQLAARCATASRMQRLWSPRTNSMVWHSNIVYFVVLRLKKTPAFGWRDEFRGGYLSLFNTMPPFVGLSTIAHGWVAKMNGLQKLAGKQREPWVFNAEPIPVKIEPVWQPYPRGNTFYVCRCSACCQSIHNRFLQLLSRHISSHFQHLKLPQRRVIHIRLALVAPNLDLHAKRRKGMFRLVLASNWVVAIRNPNHQDIPRPFDLTVSSTMLKTGMSGEHRFDWYCDPNSNLSMFRNTCNIDWSSVLAQGAAIPPARIETLKLLCQETVRSDKPNTKQLPKASFPAAASATVKLASWKIRDSRLKRFCQHQTS